MSIDEIIDVFVTTNLVMTTNYDLSVTKYLLWPIAYGIIILFTWTLNTIPVVGGIIYTIGIFIPPVITGILVINVPRQYFTRFLAIAISGIGVLPVMLGIVAAIDGSGFEAGISLAFLVVVYYTPIAMIAAIFNRPNDASTEEQISDENSNQETN